MGLPAKVGMTLNYVIDASCFRYEELPAIGMAMEKPLTYGEFRGRIIALAGRLLSEGINKGDRVAVLGENSHNWGMAYLAIVRLGAVAVPILPDLPEADVHHILNEMEVKGIFTTQKQIEKIYELRKTINGPVITLDDYRSELSIVPVMTFSNYLDGALAQHEQHGENPVFPIVEEDDPAAILYTSG
ncbi:MAG: AMP-binding protein, partial [Desulforhopalus sp.]